MARRFETGSQPQRFDADETLDPCPWTAARSTRLGICARPRRWWRSSRWRIPLQPDLQRRQAPQRRSRRWRPSRRRRRSCEIDHRWRTRASESIAVPRIWRRTRFARADQTQPVSQERIQAFTPVPIKRQDWRSVPRVRHRPRPGTQARRGRRAQQYAVADEGGGEGERQVGVRSNVVVVEQDSPDAYHAKYFGVCPDCPHRRRIVPACPKPSAQASVIRCKSPTRARS